MNATPGPSTPSGRRPVPRPRPGEAPPRRRRPRPVYDPPPRTFGEMARTLWIVGVAAIVLVVLAVVVSGPGDISILGRLFIWCSTLVFSVWLLREHRRRIPVAQRQVIFLVGAGSLVVLFLVLTISAF